MSKQEHRTLMSRPYRLETTMGKRWRLCLLFGAFVFLFLFIFQPFGISSYPYGIVKLSLGYGMTTFVVMAVLNIALFSLLPNYFNEESWTVGKELSWNLLNIAIIGLANALFTGYVDIAHISVYTLTTYEFYTLVVGIFPVSISVLIKEAALTRRYETKSEAINTEIDAHKKDLPPAPETNDNIFIPSDTANESLELKTGELYYIRSSDNYVEVYYHRQGKETKKLLRNSLKKVGELLADHPRFFRCHKSYLVNLDKVTHVSGNAQGYKLHLEGMEDTVPVSRQYNDEIKERLAAHT